MTYEELVTKVKEATRNARVSKAVGHVAFQFNIRGEAEGAFYLEICDGRIIVEPYEYYDRDVVIETTADVLIQMLEDGLLPRIAFANDQLNAYGNVDQLEVLPFGCDKAKIN